MDGTLNSSNVADQEESLKENVSSMKAKPGYWIKEFNTMLSADTKYYQQMRQIEKQKRFNDEQEKGIRDYNVKMKTLVESSLPP